MMTTLHMQDTPTERASSRARPGKGHGLAALLLMIVLAFAWMGLGYVLVSSEIERERATDCRLRIYRDPVTGRDQHRPAPALALASDKRC